MKSAHKKNTVGKKNIDHNKDEKTKEKNKNEKKKGKKI